jgi:biopolymer transport protein ExbB
MNTLFSLIVRGGPVMIPIVLLSILTIATGLERIWFWFQLFRQEDKVVHDVLDAARFDLERAMAIAEQSQSNPMGRFLLAPLRLRQPTPETFRLAMEAAADKEFVQMKKGDKFLETVVAVSPLLGLLGTVTGLIATFGNLNIGGGGTTEQATQAAAGIGEALITTAAGMVVAILALVIYRLFVTFQAQQMNYFSDVGSELELVYRQVWYEPNAEEEDTTYVAPLASGNPSER